MSDFRASVDVNLVRGAPKWVGLEWHDSGRRSPAQTPATDLRLRILMARETGYPLTTSLSSNAPIIKGFCIFGHPVSTPAERAWQVQPMFTLMWCLSIRMHDYRIVALPDARQCLHHLLSAFMSPSQLGVIL